MACAKKLLLNPLPISVAMVALAFDDSSDLYNKSVGRRPMGALIRPGCGTNAGVIRPCGRPSAIDWLVGGLEV